MKRKFTGNFMYTKHALLNAAFITFSKTLLLKGSETVSRFGKIIHSYTMQQAVSDDKALRDFIDYVILDERCHLKKHKIIAQHSGHFWNA
ncbi:hypothetical protein [Acetobacter sp. AAB5]|uniref:hypothetical protein n=1 Tax=Acetobacter sp. AAB5 TaxID=3418370 RepID=UPI003CECD608